MGGTGSGRFAKPIGLHLAEGNPSHLTKAEIEERQNGEINVPFTDVQPPEYLTGQKQIDKFNYYAEMLLALGIFTELDVDCLARYIVAESLYLQYTSLLSQMIKKKELDDLSRIQTMQDKAFRQCQSCARDLGLTITSRCKLVVPPPPDDDDEL